MDDTYSIVNLDDSIFPRVKTVLGCSLFLDNNTMEYLGLISEKKLKSIYKKGFDDGLSGKNVLKGKENANQ